MSGGATLKLVRPTDGGRTFKMTQDYAAADKLDSLAGWLVALSAFIAGFVAFGVTYSFGAFFTSMEAEFHASRTETSAFFAVTGMLFYFFGSITGRLSDRFGPQPIVAAGAVIMGAGLILTAAAPRMWIGYLAYSAGAGIGAPARMSQHLRSLADGSRAIAQRRWAWLRPAPDAARC